MEYMIRFTQVHETFRLAEIEALAVLEGIKLEVLSYSPSVSFSPFITEFYLTFYSHHFASSNSNPRKRPRSLSSEVFSQRQSMKSGGTAQRTMISMTMFVASHNTYGLCTETVHSNSP